MRSAHRRSGPDGQRGMLSSLSKRTAQAKTGSRKSQTPKCQAYDENEANWERFRLNLATLWLQLEKKAKFDIQVLPRRSQTNPKYNNPQVQFYSQHRFSWLNITRGHLGAVLEHGLSFTIDTSAAWGETVLQLLPIKDNNNCWTPTMKFKMISNVQRHPCVSHIKLKPGKF